MRYTPHHSHIHIACREINSHTQVHTADTCKCHLPIHMMGQDESIYWQYLLSSKVWYINGACGLRKKGNGPGIMVSEYIIV